MERYMNLGHLRTHIQDWPWGVWKKLILSLGWKLCFIVVAHKLFTLLCGHLQLVSKYLPCVFPIDDFYALSSACTVMPYAARYICCLIKLLLAAIWEMSDHVFSLWIMSFFMLCTVEAEGNTARMTGKLFPQLTSEKFNLWSEFYLIVLFTEFSTPFTYKPKSLLPPRGNLAMSF